MKSISNLLAPANAAPAQTGFRHSRTEAGPEAQSFTPVFAGVSGRLSAAAGKAGGQHPNASAGEAEQAPGQAAVQGQRAAKEEPVPGQRPAAQPALETPAQHPALEKPFVQEEELTPEQGEYAAQVAPSAEAPAQPLLHPAAVQVVPTAYQSPAVARSEAKAPAADLTEMRTDFFQAKRALNLGDQMPAMVREGAGFQNDSGQFAENRAQLLRALANLGVQNNATLGQGSGANPPAPGTGGLSSNAGTSGAEGRFDVGVAMHRAPVMAEWSPVTVARQQPHWTQDLMSALGERLSMQLSQNVKEAVVRLDPPDLGRIELTVRLDGDRLNVQLNANNVQIRDMLTQHAERLRMDLAEQNAQTVEVNIGQEGQKQGSGQPQSDSETVMRGLNIAELAETPEEEQTNNGWVSTSA